MPKSPGQGEAPAFPLDPRKVWGGGAGNNARNGSVVTVPGTVPGQQARVRVVDWSHPYHVDIPVQVSVVLRDWAAPKDGYELGGTLIYRNLRGRIEYARGQEKIVEEIGFPADGFYWRGCVREFTLQLWRDDGEETPITVVASITPEPYTYQRTRQSAIWTPGEEDGLVPIIQRVPYGVTRYRASVSPWATVADIEWYDNDGIGPFDVVPALAVADWQALPTWFDQWAQDVTSLNAPNAFTTITQVTIEFE